MKNNFHDDRVSLDQILDEINFALETYDSGRKDRGALYIVIRCVEVIGEACNRLTDEIKNKYPEIQWRLIINMRNKLIHGYDNIDQQRVWQVVEKELPNLKKQIKKIIENEHS